MCFQILYTNMSIQKLTVLFSRVVTFGFVNFILGWLLILIKLCTFID